MVLNKTHFTKIVLLLALSACSGCYGGKFVKMPINADIASRRLDTLKTRQQRIMKSLDTLSHQLKDEKEERLRNGAGIEARLSEIEEALRILSSKVDDSMQLMMGIKRPAAPFRAIDPHQSTGDSLSGTVPDSLQKENDSAGDNSDEDDLYKTSYMDLTLGNFALSVQGFKNYLVRYPGGSHLVEVHYYLGESYYSTEKYLEAVGEYQFIIREYSKSRLVPASYLKAGLCYAKLDEPALAEKSFRQLISLYPYSEEAEHARAALKDLEG